MSIAIPVAAGRLTSHFGHCEKFAFLEVNEATHTIIDLNLIDPPAHEPGILPRWLHEKGAKVVIAGGMGQRAQELLAQHGIHVVIGAPEEGPRELAAAYLAGTLRTGANVCDH